MKLLMNLDPFSQKISRVELYNRSSAAHTFEANSIAKEQPAIVEALKVQLLKWAKTTYPIPPNTMSSRSQHLGCEAYSMAGAPDGYSSSDLRMEVAAASMLDADGKWPLDAYRH